MVMSLCYEDKLKTNHLSKYNCCLFIRWKQSQFFMHSCHLNMIVNFKLCLNGSGDVCLSSSYLRMYLVTNLLYQESLTTRVNSF